MTIVIFGAPKPYSAQRRDRSLIRSRYGVFMNVAGSTGGKLPVVSGMGGKLRAPRRSPYGLSRADFGGGLWTRHNALDRGGQRRVAGTVKRARIERGMGDRPVEVQRDVHPRQAPLRDAVGQRGHA